MNYTLDDLKPGFTFWLKGEKLRVRKLAPACGACCAPEIMAHLTTLDGFGRGQIAPVDLLTIANKHQLTFDELFSRFPEGLRKRIETCAQDPVYHPEGCVQNHLEQVFNYAQLHFPGEDQLLLCALFHDLGKPETQQFKTRENGSLKISNIGHEHRAQYYIDLYLDLFADLHPNKALISEVCKYHMYAHLYVNHTVKKAAKRQAFEALPYFLDLIKFAECDDQGRQKIL